MSNIAKKYPIIMITQALASGDKIGFKPNLIKKNTYPMYAIIGISSKSVPS